jgi:hypothetical protein
MVVVFVGCCKKSGWWEGLAGVLAAEDSFAGSGKSAGVQCGHVGLCVLWT